MRNALLTALFFPLTTIAQNTDCIIPDSTQTTIEERKPSFYAQYQRLTMVAFPLFSIGQVMKHEDAHFRSLRHDHLPRFRQHLDDYLQYSPAAALVGMKLAGIESRNNWGRMLVSDAFATALMAGAINTLKHTTRVERPDGSSCNSFPSGHTATAFMTASMFTKEYGHRYPWLCVGAYSVATATGLMRIANNRHWMSDVITGAGVGILSAEMGYYLADLIFGNRGQNIRESEIGFAPDDRPSFFSLYVGFNSAVSHYAAEKQTTILASAGSCTGVEGAYFFTPRWGWGGRVAASNTFLLANGEGVNTQPVNIHTFATGAYYSHYLSPRWLFGGKAVVGGAHIPRLESSQIQQPCSFSWCFGTGVSFTFKARQNFGLKLFCDYNYLPFSRQKKASPLHLVSPGTAFVLLL